MNTTIPRDILYQFIVKARYAGFFDLDLRGLGRLYNSLRSKYIYSGLGLIVLGGLLTASQFLGGIVLLLIGVVLLLNIKRLILSELDDMISRRKIQYLFISAFAASLIAMYIRLGYNIQKILEELSKQDLGILSKELRRVLMQVQRGHALAEVFLNYATYIPEEQMRAVLLELHREYMHGADRKALARAIISKSREMRDRLLVEYEKAKGSMQMGLTFHMTLNLLPLIVVVLSGMSKIPGMIISVSIPIHVVFIVPIVQIALIFYVSRKLSI